MVRRAHLIAVAVLVACEHDDVPDRGDAAFDAGPEDDASNGPGEPEPPALPILGPCRDGWLEVDDPAVDGLRVCEPFGGGAPSDCGDGEAHLPGTAGCAPIGTDCPDGDWAEDLPLGEEIVYVRAGAPGGGTGTREMPAGSIARGLALARGPAILALSRGTFDEPVRLMDEGVTLWGACPTETTLTRSDAPGAMAVVEVHESGARLRNLTITGPSIAIVAIGGSELELQSVEIRDTIGTAIVAVDATVAAQDLVIRRVGFDETGDFAAGIQAHGGALTLSGASIERTAVGLMMGESAEGRATVVAHDLVVRDGFPEELSGTGGDGVELQFGVDATLEGFAGYRLFQDAVGALGEGSNLVARDVWIRDVAISPGDGKGGIGIYVREGFAEVERVLVEGSEVGVEGFEGATITARDVVVRNTSSQFGDGAGGMGLHGYDGVDLSFARVAVHDATSFGLFSGQGANVHGTDFTVSHSVPVREFSGDGITAFMGGRAELTRCLISSAAHVGVWSTQPGSVVVLEDCVLEQTAVLQDAGGFGLSASGGGVAEVTRFRIRDNGLGGVQVGAESAVDLHDGIVSGNPIGANIQEEAFDLSRLQDRVLFQGNDRSFDATFIPVPQMPPLPER